MAKQAITQRSFILGETRSGFLEADDLEIRMASCRAASNVRVTATRAMRSRPGTFWTRELGTAYDLIELRPETGQVFGLIVNNTSLEIVDSTGRVVHSELVVPWTDAAAVWIEPFREDTIIGGIFGLKTLAYDDGVWTLTDFAFSDSSGGQKAQPYWSFQKDIRVRPSAREGNITLTANLSFWSAGYVGERIRYGKREILITGYVSPTVLNGTVVALLPPSFRLTLSTTSGFNTGDAVIGQDTNFQGLIIAISGLTIDVVTTDFFDGPDVAEKISSPNNTGTVSAKAEISPLESPIWDEPLMSPVRGYPRAGASAAGRLALTDFPLVPDLICLSSNRSVKDFQVGADDDDAITRQAGDNAPRFLHIINAGDLLLFSDRGLYYISIRDGGILTPSNFNVILFDKRASSPVRPVSVDDGVVFVEASGQAIGACLLDGNIYLKWSVRTISTYHSHLIKSPIKLCGPSQFAETPEKYLFVVNGDGTLAALSWFSDFQADSVGFVPWSTQGTFKTISPIFGGYMAVVDRTINDVSRRYLERLSDAAMLDCSVNVFGASQLFVNGDPFTVNGLPFEVAIPSALPLAGETVHVFGSGWYGGTRETALDGSVPDIEDMPQGTYAGLNFTSSIEPWPVERIDTPRSGMLTARLIRGSVSVLASAGFKVRANRSVKEFTGYDFGDDLTLPPPLKTRVCKFSVIGRRDHPEIEIIKDEPGAFEVLAITQEVQY